MDDIVKKALKAYEYRNSYKTDDKTVSKALDLYKKRREYTAKDDVADIQERLTKEIENYKSYINQPISHGYGKTASKQVIESQRQSRINLNKLKTEIESYKDFIEDSYKYSSQVDSMLKGYDSVLEYANQFSKFETEDDYKKALEELEQSENMMAYDREAGQVEIDNLESILAKAQEFEGKINKYEGQKNNLESRSSGMKTDGGYGVKLSNTKKEYSDYLSSVGYASIDEIKNTLSQKKAFHGKAIKTQDLKSLVESPQKSNDFLKYANEGSTVENPNYEDALGNNIFGIKFGGEDVTNKVEFVRNNRDKILAAFGDAVSGGGVTQINGLGEFDDGDWLNLILNMDENEVNTYNYYIGKGETENADKYLKSLKETLRDRVKDEIYSGLEGKPALELAFGVVAGLDQVKSGVENLFNTEDDYIVPSTIQMVSSAVREDLSTEGPKILGSSIGQIGYDAITTVSNMMPSMAISYATMGTASALGASAKVASKAGQIAGNIALGASAAGNEYAEMLNAGMNKDQAKAIGIIKGAWEGASEYYLGTIEGLGTNYIGKKLSGTALSKSLEKVGKGTIKGAIDFFGNNAMEGLEEVVQDIGSSVIDGVMTGKWEFATAEEQAYNFTLGMLSAFVLNTPSKADNIATTYRKGKNLKSNEGAVNRLAELGHTYAADTVAYKLADKVNEKTGAYTVGRLLNSLGAELTSQNQADIVRSLERKGFDTNSAETIATWLAKAVEGEYFTSSQKKLLENNEAISTTFKDVIINQNSTVNQRTQSIMDINGVEGTSGVDLTQIHRDYTKDKIEERINLESELKRIATESAMRKLGVGQSLSRETDAMLDSMVDDAVKQYGARTINKINKTEADILNENKVSESGKTTLVSTGEEVNIRKINSINPKKKELTFELDNGKIVSNKDIQYANNNIALAYESMVNLGYDLDTANAMVQILSANSVKPNNQLLLGLNKAYEYGWGHIPESARTDADFNALTETQKAMAIKLGQDARAADDKARESQIPDGQKANAKKSGGKEFGATLESYGTKVPKRVQVSVEALDAIGKKLQTRFIVSDLKGKSNGYYSKSENAFVIDINAGLKGQYTLLWTASHELVHYFRRWSPSDFTTLADFLMQRYAESGKNIDELIAIEQDKAFKATNGKDVMSYDAAYEEVVAQAMQEFLTDSNFITELSTLQKSNPGLVQKIIDTLRKILEDVREWYKGLTPSDKATAYVKEMGQAANEMYDMLSKGLFKASETSMAMADNTVSTETKSTTTEMQNESIQSVADVATDTDGKPLFQYKAMEADEEKYRTMLTKHGLMNESQIDYLFKTVDMALKKIKANLEALDYAWETDINERGFSPIKPNSDHLYKVSLDFSTLCRKRILQQVIQSQLQDALNTQLTREEGIAIRNELMQIQEEGRQIEIACALCYVESARMKSNAQIKKFLKNRDQIIKEFFAGTNPGEVKQKIKDAEVSKRQELIKRFKNDDIATMSLKDIKKEYGGKVAQEIRDAKKAVKRQYVPTAEEQKLIDKANTMSISDFTTPEGLENLVKNYPRLFDAYTSFIRNATKSKGIENDTWWRAGDSYSVDKNGDPVLSDALVDAMNRENGLRSQSWSDFQVIHLLDYMAAIIELSTRNAKMQTYTKVADLVHLMGNTNLMLNLSLIPSRTFNGKLDFDSVEGMPFKTALELRDKYHATAGTISIGINDEQIRMLLASELIDYVIPYHKSGMSQAIRKLMHIPTWDEYENYQNESSLNGGNAEENAKKYGVKLNTDKNIWHKTPNFSDWFDFEVAKQIAQMENANPSNKEEAKKYGVMYGAYKAMQNAAEEYKKVCAERGLAPKFEQFLDEANYWKLLIDRKMIDNITGEIIEQKAVTPQFDRGEVMRILDDEVARYPKVKADQDYAINEVVKRFLSKDFKSKSNKNLKLSEDTETALSESINGISKVNILSSVQDTYSLISEDISNTVQDIVQEFGTSDESLVEAEVSDVVNTTDIKNQYKNGDETYSKIGKEMLGYQEGNRKPDLTLVEVYNDRTGKTETTIKFVGDKPKGYIPQKIAYCYKLFEQHPDGTLHALFAGASNATPIGEWIYSQGFPYTDSGVKGMNLRERYGWHLSAGLPSAPHLMSTKDFNRGYPSKAAYGHPKGSKRVWVRMAYDASTDFNSIADSTKAGDIFGLIPFGGYYAFKENNQSEWVISSAVKIEKILKEEERQQILKDAGYDEYEAWRKKHRATEAEKLENKRKSAENKKAKDKAIKDGLNYLSENSKAMRESIKSRIIDNPELSGNKYQYKVTPEQDTEYLELAKNPEKNEKRLRQMVDDAAIEAGALIGIGKKPILLRHGTNADFYTFDGNKTYPGTFGYGHYFATDKSTTESYGRREIKSYLITNKIVSRYTHNITPENIERFLEEYGINSSELYGYYTDSLDEWVEKHNDLEIIKEAQKLAMRYETGKSTSDLLYDTINILGVDAAEVYLGSHSYYVVYNNSVIKSADPITYDDNGNIIPLSERFNSENEDIRYQYKDSEGNALTEAQQEFFKDSKVRDKEGNLLLMYHGTKAQFTVFERDKIGSTGRMEGSGFNFTPSKSRASSYSDGTVLGGYLNIARPLSADKKTITMRQLANIIKEIDPTGDNIIANYAYETRDYGKDSFIKRESLTTAKAIFDFCDNDADIYAELSSANPDADSLISKFQSLGYDGVIHYNEDGTIKTAVTFDSNQFKNADNLNPTSDPDIRYQYRDAVESENKILDLENQISDIEEQLADDIFDEMPASEKKSMNNKLWKLRNELNKLENAERHATVKTSLADIRDNLDNYRYIDLRSLAEGFGWEDYEDMTKNQLASAMREYLNDIEEEWKDDESSDFNSAKDGMWVRPIYDSDNRISRDGNIIEVKFQYRDTDATDNRTLLSNALASTAQNEIEKKYIEQYQSKIDTINAEQKKLTELRAKIKELSFAKGHRDAEQIRKLQDEATKTANRINTFDKQLLKLESAKPLKEVLNREKTLAKKKAEKAGKEALDAYKERAAKTQRELMDRYQTRIKKGKENRDKTELRHKIRKIADDFKKRLLNGTDSHYVPKNLVEGIISVCNEIDPTGQDQNTKVAEKYRSGKAALAELKLAYDSLKTEDYEFSSEFNEEFSKNIEDLAKTVGDTPLRDMSKDQLEDVYNIIHDIKAMLQDATKQIGTSEKISNYEAGQELIALMQGIKGLRLTTNEISSFFRNWMENPMRAVREMSAFNPDSRLVKLFNALNEGRRKMDTFRMEANKEFDALRSTKEGEKNFNDAVEMAHDFGLTDINGNPLKISKMQAMQLVLTWNREQANENRKHLQSGAIIPDVDLQRKGKFKEAFDNGQQIGMVTPEVIAKIMDGLSEWDKQYMETARKFFNGKAKDAVNETSMITRHRIIASEKEYIPYEVNKDYVSKDSDNVKFDATIEGMGMLKSVKNNAPQMLVMGGLNSILADHIDNVGKLYGLSVPIRNWNKVFNMRQTDADGGMSVKAAIRNTWKDAGVNLLDQAVADLQTPRRHDSVKLLSTIKSAQVASTLASNISVWMKQAASYPTAGAVLSQKALTKGLIDYVTKIKDGVHAQDVWDEIDAHTSQHWIRRQGLSMQELGDFNQSKGWLNKVNNKLGKASPMNWIQAMDVATTAALWYACKAEVDSTAISKGSDEYWEAVTELYDKVIEETQPMYDSLHRAEITKKDQLKNFIVFQTQPLQNSGILREGAMEYKMAKKQYGKDSKATKQAGKKFRMAVGSQMASHFVFTAMTLIAGMLLHKVNPWRDDDDELTAESVTKNFAIQFSKNYFNAIVPIIGNYATSLCEVLIGGSRNEVMTDFTVDRINTTINTFAKLKEPTFENFANAFCEVASYFGIPASNAKNIVNGVILHVQDVMNGEFGSFEAGVDRTTGQEVSRVYTAYESGDTAKMKSILNELIQEKIDSGKDEKEAKSAIRASITSKYKPIFLKAYSKNDTVTMAQIRKFLNATGIYDDVVETTQNWIKKSKESE